MRTRRFAVAGLVVLASLGSAATAVGHQGHTSCQAGTESFTVPLAQSGQLGELASSLGQQGLVGETSEQLHAAGCEPK